MIEEGALLREQFRGESQIPAPGSNWLGDQADGSVNLQSKQKKR
jgi:hypothetical protein